MLLAVLCFLLAGWSGLVVGFLWSTVLVYHATFCINSLAHVSGSKRYVTGDDSRNNWLLAFFTMGEGWHNNHHAYQSSVRQGFRWWEIDPTYYALAGAVLDRPGLGPEDAARAGAAQRAAARRARSSIVPPRSSRRASIPSGLPLPSPRRCTAPELSALQDTLASAHHRTSRGAADAASAAYPNPRGIPARGQGDVCADDVAGRDRRSRL